MHTSQQGKLFAKFFLMVFLIGMGVFTVYAYGLDRTIVKKFENRRWDIPARIYSRPLVLQKGAMVDKNDVNTWLNLLHYSEKSDESIGSYKKINNGFLISARQFDYGDGDIDRPRLIEIKFNGNKISSLRSTIETKAGFVRLEPVEIGSIYPDSNEDRHLIGLKETPQTLIDALIATEDRGFYEHYGVSIRGTTRAILNNVLGGSKQGGSTLTQQLIKNFYLTSEKSLKRKANEAIMALLLERHYSKDDILQAYINEINLGQNGNQSINGFGIAAKFYFNKNIGELQLHQHALLVGIAKGSSYYNPRKHPERALERRNVVLNNMLVTGKISEQDYEKAIVKPLDVVETPTIAKPKFPDFLDYARRELAERYKSEDLKSAGLRIVTTLDPLAQRYADTALKTGLNKYKKKNLQGALVSANPKTGEVLALVGSSSEFTGFNRAIDAKRQVGSLLKPVIYLTALQSGQYNLASGVDDSAKTYKDWTPKNYNGISHGVVPLTTALANSYNQSAVNLGMEVGLVHFVNYLKQLGIDDKVPNYPSVLLGAVDLSPMQMLGMYQVFANGGTYAPLYSIDSVIDESGRLLQKNQIQSDRRVPEDASYLLHEAMTYVVKDGTAKSALSLGDLNLAGKTGTTNDARDAWFAGYSGNYVSVVWVGRDDNKPIGLTGGSGALPIWLDYMNKLNLSKVNFVMPKALSMAWVENGTGRATDETCENAIYIPVKSDSVSNEPSECQLAKEEEARQAELLEAFGDEAVSFDKLSDDGTEDTQVPSDDTSPSEEGVVSDEF